MTRNQYAALTTATRRALARLPGGERLLLLPTLLVALAYAAGLCVLAVQRDMRIVRALLVPAACFMLVTILRPIIGRQRPYDRFGLPPVGSYTPGKGKSMPSRHTASAAAIACAAVYIYANTAVALVMGGLCMMVAALRVLTGKHYPSDVLVGLALSAALSFIGYWVI